MNITVLVNPTQVVNEFWDAVITNMNEEDKAGIEFALQLKGKKGGTVTAVAIGNGEEADTALREAFAMGVDHAALMSAEEASSDNIVAALQKVGGDVFVSGRQDDEIKKAVQALNAAEKQCTEVNLENFLEQTPCFVYASASAFIPRHMQVGGVYSAYSRQIENISLHQL